MRWLDSATHQCNGLTVRHTPAFGHPSPRGDGLTRHFNCQWFESVALPRHPLSERGGRRPGCVAPSSPNNNTHPQSSNLSTPPPFKPSNLPTLQPSHPLPRHPLSERGGRRPGCVAPSNPNNNSRPLQTLQPSNFPPPSNTGCCPLVVRLMSACCPLLKRTTSGHQADNKRTTTGLGPSRRRGGAGGVWWRE